MSQTRILIVDDSSTVRAVLRRILSSNSDLEVVGEAADGISAIEKAQILAPDAVVMDLDLPGVNGYVATEEIFRQRPTPVVVVTSKLEGREEILQTFGTVRRGVVDIFAKPRTPRDWDTLGHELVETLRQLGPGEGQTTPPPTSASAHDFQADAGRRRVRYLAIGASTGGPGALSELLGELGRPLPFAVIIAQHISEGFDSGLAQWLSHDLGADVSLCQDDERLEVGTARIAPADSVVRIDGEGRQHITPVGQRQFGASIDELFLSMAEWRPSETVAVLLSGMGRDGVSGLLALRKKGALTMVQDQESCAVFGMPKVALCEGAADLALSPSAIGRLLRQMDRRSR